MFSVTCPVLMHFPPNNYTEQIYGIYFLDFWHANEPAHLLLTKRTSTEHTNSKIILFYLRHTARRCSGSAAPEMISLPPTLLIRAQTVPRHPEIWTKVVVIQKTLFCSFLGKSQEAWSVCTLHNKVTSGKFGNFCWFFSHGAPCVETFKFTVTLKQLAVGVKETHWPLHAGMVNNYTVSTYTGILVNSFGCACWPFVYMWTVFEVTESREKHLQGKTFKNSVSVLRCGRGKPRWCQSVVAH